MDLDLDLDLFKNIAKSFKKSLIIPTKLEVSGT
jgi:hypothetical protein